MEKWPTTAGVWARKGRCSPARRALLGFTAAVLVLGLDLARASGAESFETKHLVVDPYGITVDHRTSDERVARMVASIFERRTPVIAEELGLARVEPFRVVLVPDIGEYERRVGYALPPWGVAFAFPNGGFFLVDVKRATNAWNSLEKVIAHETSHMLLAQRVPDGRMPFWFVEGLAEWQARDWSILDTWGLMESVWKGSAPRLDRMSQAAIDSEDRAREAYRVAYAGFQHRFGDRWDRLPEFLDEIASLSDFSVAFEAYWKETEQEFSARFARHLESKYKSGLMLFQTGPLFTVISVLFVVVVAGRWARNRRRLKRMEEAERGSS